MAGFYSIMVAWLIAPGAVDSPMNQSEKEAIAELKTLGAKVVFRPSAADREAEQVLLFVLIDKNWKGGDEGLKLIEQLPGLPSLYITERPKISEERLAKLQKSLPDLKIQYRTKAMLGISSGGVPSVAGCVIASVKSESPAAKAGLIEGDVIIQFDGKPIRSFDDLLKEQSRKEPDDEVNLTVLRKDKEINVKVKLGKWQ